MGLSPDFIPGLRHHCFSPDAEEMNVSELEMSSQQHPSAGGSVVLHDSVSLQSVTSQRVSETHRGPLKMMQGDAN